MIGPSGSGKTTLLNLISGILVPEEGDVRVNDVPVNTLKDDDRRDFRIRTIGFIFQDFELLDYLSVMDNILHPYRITGALVIGDDIVVQVEDIENLFLQAKLTPFPITDHHWKSHKSLPRRKGSRRALSHQD